MTVICIECGADCTLTTGDVIYPHRTDLWHKAFWQCPACDAYCGCHPDTVKPLGKPCGPVTRGIRQRAHVAFDALWKGGLMKRGEAYRWLRAELSMTADECHIGQMNGAQALAVIEAAQAYPKSK